MKETEIITHNKTEGEPTEDFLQAFQKADSALVFLERLSAPRNTWVSFPDSDTSWLMSHAFSCLHIQEEEFGKIFEQDRKGERYTGYFARGGRQVFANILNKPLLYISEREAVDERRYTEWVVFYPGKNPEATDSWQTKLLSRDTVVLTPKVEKDRTELPVRVHIPNLPYVFERARLNASDLFEPQWVDKRVNKIGVRQKNMEFDPLEVKEGLVKIINIDGKETLLRKDIDVPGAFVGKFAGCLAGIGLKVRASDALPAYVEQLQRRGLNAQLFLAERLPKIRGGKFATITFELYSLVGSETFYLAMLREMVRSQGGIIFVEKKDCGLKTFVSKADRDFNDYCPEIDAYTGFGAIYGLSVRVVDTDSLRFMSLETPSEDKRKEMHLDLRVMYVLGRAVNHGHLNRRPLEIIGNECLNRRFALPLDFKELTHKFGVKEQEVVASLNRIEEGNTIIGHDFDEETFERDKEHGGPMSVLEIIKPECAVSS